MGTELSRPLQLFVIAGEPSGDALGGPLLKGLRALTGDAVRFTGIGGPEMRAEGLESLIPMDRLSVMGLAEVLPRLPEILRHIRTTADAVAQARPDALITIDSPDFCLRVARRAKAVRPGLRTIHYVAPSVWAWRPGRARKMARSVDHVLALLPFEPPWMTAAGMSCDFVGHPIADRAPAPAADRAALRARLGVAAGAPLLCLAPGSRAGEVARHGALFRQVWDRLAADLPGLHGVIPTLPARAAEVRAQFAGAHGVTVLDPEVEGTGAGRLKAAAFAEATAALAVSGTVSLELAAAGTPMAVAYRANPLSAAVAKRLVKVRHASLVNILEDRTVIPEYLFEAATPTALTAEVARLLTDPAARARQIAGFDAALHALGRGQEEGGLRAARSVLRAIA